MNPAMRVPNSSPDAHGLVTSSIHPCAPSPSTCILHPAKAVFSLPLNNVLDQIHFNFQNSSTCSFSYSTISFVTKSFNGLLKLICHLFISASNPSFCVGSSTLIILFVSVSEADNDAIRALSTNPKHKE